MTLRLRRPQPVIKATWCLDAEAGGAQGNVDFLRQVRPSLDLYPFCIDPKLELNSVVVGAGGGAITTIWTVPVTQPLYIYNVRNLYLDRSAGDNTMSSLLLASKVYEDEGGATQTYITLDTWAAAASRLVALAQPIWVRPGDYFAIDPDAAGVAATTFRLFAWVDRLRCG